MNKTDILQQMIDDIQKERPEIGDWIAEYKGKSGWWVFPCEPRFIGDNGEFLGKNYKQAKHAIIELFE